MTAPEPAPALRRARRRDGATLLATSLSLVVSTASCHGSGFEIHFGDIPREAAVHVQAACGDTPDSARTTHLLEDESQCVTLPAGDDVTLDFALGDDVGDDATCNFAFLVATACDDPRFSLLSASAPNQRIWYSTEPTTVAPDQWDKGFDDDLDHFSNWVEHVKETALDDDASSPSDVSQDL